MNLNEPVLQTAPMCCNCHIRPAGPGSEICDTCNKKGYEDMKRNRTEGVGDTAMESEEHKE